MNASFEKFAGILNDCITDQVRIDADDLARSVDLDAGQIVTWLSTARIDQVRVNIFFCEAEGEDEAFMLTRHGHAGLVLSFDGPYPAFAEAKREAGFPAGGWTDI